MSEQVWSEWIEHTPGDPCPIPWAKRDEWIWRLGSWDDDGRVSCRTAADDKDWGCQPGSARIVGYRYLLSAAPAGFVPPEIEATQKPETPAADALEDARETNRLMFAADEAGLSAGKWDRHNARAALSAPTPAPPFMVGGVRSSDGLLTEWPVGDHRLGGWQA